MSGCGTCVFRTGCGNFRLGRAVWETWFYWRYHCWEENLIFCNDYDVNRSRSSCVVLLALLCVNVRWLLGSSSISQVNYVKKGWDGSDYSIEDDCKLLILTKGIQISFQEQIIFDGSLHFDDWTFDYEDIAWRWQSHWNADNQLEW